MARGKWRKYDLIHALTDIHGYRSVLEISTASTGGTHKSIDRSRFDVCRRLAYLAPADWSDGAPVDYRSSEKDTGECIREIREQGLRFDIVFVDAWHEYEIARRDLADALSLVTDDGIVLAHDCLPETEDGSSPWREGKFVWWGVSYKLYVDFLLERDDLTYCTVNTDFGCGMVRKTPKTKLYRRATDMGEELAQAWRNIGGDFTAAYRFYQSHQQQLMNVVSVSDFLAAERESAREIVPLKHPVLKPIAESGSR
jgi:hypothetical protein